MVIEYTEHRSLVTPAVVTFTLRGIITFCHTTALNRARTRPWPWSRNMDVPI